MVVVSDWVRGLGLIETLVNTSQKQPGYQGILEKNVLYPFRPLRSCVFLQGDVEQRGWHSCCSRHGIAIAGKRAET